MTDELFVGIQNPAQVRRDMIVCSKSIVEALIKFEEQYKEVRSQKLDQLTELKKVVDDLSFLNKKLRAHLPQVKDASPQKITHDHLLPSEQPAAPKKKLVKMPPKKKTRLEQLREELDKLDKKVARIEQ